MKNLLIFSISKILNNKNGIPIGCRFFMQKSTQQQVSGIIFMKELYYSLSERNLSASIAAIHPEPADVIACR